MTTSLPATEVKPERVRPVALPTADAKVPAAKAASRLLERVVAVARSEMPAHSHEGKGKAQSAQHVPGLWKGS